MKSNELIHEKSPYLLQHAYNPVNWYPWGAEAFEKAKKEDKPIFLSIGYSTCHWCHVMERESFEDSEVAELLNRDFVSIKVDREERPDIDSVYMNVCMAFTGSGGWPLTIIMTTEQKPFYAATYIPKNQKYGTVGMTELLPVIADLWKNKRRELLRTGNEIISVLKERKGRKNEKISKKLLIEAADTFKSIFDRKYGGFGAAPKFPSPHNLLFLIRYSYYENDKNALEMAEKTLEQMYRGGIFDHIGGGFSRYSTDSRWLVPHFEKMLYDNALLIYTYAESYQLTKNELYKNVAERTIEYVLRELTDTKHGFYCGQDADSEGVEGKYYTFTPDEVKSVLGEKDGSRFCNSFDITEDGNFEGKSIPNLLKKIAEADNSTLKKLYDYRLRRTSLHKDDKVLTAWNGLMIAALAMMNVLYPAKQLICVGDDIEEREINEKYAPPLTVVVKNRKNETQLSEIAPFTENYKIQEKPLYYLCEDGACSAPSRIINI